MAGQGTDIKRKIADAAMRCFQRHSYDEVSVNDICAEAKIAHSSFYRAFSGKKDVIRYLFEHTDTNSIISVEELLAAPNDFERMWSIGDRYISLSQRLGPTFIRTLMCMTVNGEIDLLAFAHSVDDWLIRLTRNCQQTGIIRSEEPAEVLGPLFVDLDYHVIYEWSAAGGKYPVRAQARQRAELAANLAPEYRWSAEQYAEADC